MDTPRFVQVEVFTDTPGRGNPAGVVLTPSPVTDTAQRRWAETVRKPGNGFLWPASGAAWHARFHTPGREVGLSGHTALASAHVVLAGLSRVTLRSRTEELVIAREADELWLTLPRPKLEAFDAPLVRIARAFGITADMFDPGDAVVRTGDGDLLLPLSVHVDPLTLTPDFAALSAIGSELGTRGFCVFTQRTNHPESHLQSRFFAPHVGVEEDIATGSVHGPLAVRLWELGRIRAQSPTLRLTGEQGDALGRPCRVRVELTIDDGALVKVRVGGSVVTLEERAVSPGELGV